MVKKAKKKTSAKATKKVAKKATKKVAKKTAKKAAKKTAKKAAKKAAKKVVKAKKVAAKKSTAKKPAAKKSAAKKAPKAKKAAKPAGKAAKKKAAKPARAARKPRAPKVVVETPAAASAPEAPATSEPPAAGPKAGEPAPDFEMEDDQGERLSLSRLRGKNVVLYFYPKDDTPGCTIEACKFQEHLGTLSSHGAVVIGVSPDDAASHARFRQKYNLTFHLGVDHNAEVAKRYGVWVEKNMYGRRSMGIQRSTFLINAEGHVAAAWPKVKVEGHAEEVLAALSQI